MSRKTILLVALIFALLITFLFHHQPLGLNLILAEGLLLIWLFVFEKVKIKGLQAWAIAAAFILSALFSIITHSVFVYIMHFISLFLLAALLIYPEAKSLVSTALLAMYNMLLSQTHFLEELGKLKIKQFNIGRFLYKSRLYAIPVILITVFIIIYRNSNPMYNDLFSAIGEFFSKYLRWLFERFDFTVILSFLVCLYLINLFLHRRANSRIVLLDQNSRDLLLRSRRKSPQHTRTASLRGYYKSGVFLLVVLNLLLLLLNILDINWVWFHFEWQGQYLKPYVHNGTYLLILSILISIAVILAFFKGNLNFYPKKNILVILSYIWLAQNAILGISLAVRTYHYINYYALAYKRIGVLIFLLLTLYGLFTVYIKVKDNKSTYYLLRRNSMAAFLVLGICSFINWDVVIARYNFSHAGKSFLHLDYMSQLSDKALPYLDKSPSELEKIRKAQDDAFRSTRSYDMSVEDYSATIQHRKAQFISAWEQKNLLSWNLPEYMAYRKLTKLEQDVQSP